MTGLERMKAKMMAGGTPTATGGGDLISQGEGVLSNALAGVDPAFMESMFRDKYLPQQSRMFEEEVMPGIKESMVGAGDFWSTGRANLETDARLKFAESMQAQLADLQREGRASSINALGQVDNISGMRDRQEIDRLNTALPWLNLPTQIAYGDPTTPDNAGTTVRKPYVPSWNQAV